MSSPSQFGSSPIRALSQAGLRLFLCLVAPLAYGTQVSAQSAAIDAPIATKERPLKARFEEARDAFRAAPTQEERYRAARQIAAVRYAQGQRVAAQWWLRRAANYAPNREEADRNRADFQKIRQEVGVQFSLSFSVSPSDNVNEGVEETVFSLGDILLVFPSSALALSGIEYTGEASISVRLSENERQRTAADLSIYGRTYTLSDSARALAPTVEGSDYSVVQLAFGLSHSRQMRPNWGATTARFSAGRLWSGEEELRWFQRLDLTQAFPLPGPQDAALTLYGEQQHPLQTGQPKAVLWGARAAYQRQLPSQDALGLSFETQFYDADIETFEYRSNRVQLTYALAKPVLNLGVSFQAALANRTYDEFSLSLDGRRDRRAELGATAVFNEVTVLGFSPTFSVSAYRNWSNVDRFDTRGASAALGIRSRF